MFHLLKSMIHTYCCILRINNNNNHFFFFLSTNTTPKNRGQIQNRRKKNVSIKILNNTPRVHVLYGGLLTFICLNCPNNTVGANRDETLNSKTLV